MLRVRTGGVGMDENTKDALIIRLTKTLSLLNQNNNKLAEIEIQELIEEIKDGIVAPF